MHIITFVALFFLPATFMAVRKHCFVLVLVATQLLTLLARHFSKADSLRSMRMRRVSGMQ